MSEITETIILDANHKFSSEFLGGNKKSNALFTNKLGHGVEVKAGDQISIYNSFISEIGSTSDSIEFNDSFLERRNITKTILTPSLFINGSNDKPLGYQRVNASNITSEYIVNQNKIKISTNYYKNSNGENYFALPRRFLTENASNASTSWLGADSVAQGLPYRNGNQESELYPELNNNLLQFFWCTDDRIQYVFPNGTGETYQSVKMVNDNSRYMIFVAEETRYGKQTDNLVIPQLMHYNKQTAADYEYIEYIENIELDLNVGFNSPSTISDKLTEKLREQQEPQINYYRDSADSWQVPNLYGGDIPMSLELNSNTYKTFWSSGLRIGDKDTWTAWNKAAGENYGDNFDYIETFNPSATGGKDALITGLSTDFFVNGITGSMDPIQITGGFFVQSGNGLGSTGGFNSLAEPASTNRYFKYSGPNPRQLITKDINLLLKNPGKISLYYIQGNSTNGGENPDSNENLELRLLDKDRGVYKTIVISSGSTNYVGSLFSFFSYTMDLVDIDKSFFIEIAQTTSSQGTFDNYGVKFLQYESINDPKDTEGSNNYLSQFQYIGVKRPDLFIEGRKFARYFRTEPEYHLTQGIIKLQSEIPASGPTFEYGLYIDNFLLPKITGDLNASGQPYHQIVFDIKWSDLEKQTLLKNIFNKQENYPELFRNEQNQIGSSYPYTNVNNSRFLHMNVEDETYRKLYINHDCLGWDYQSGSSGLLNASDNINLNTCPIFFDFQPEYKDNILGGDSWEEGYRFGCFRKFKILNASGVPIDYVSITTGKMYENISPMNASQASIPNPFFDLNGTIVGKINNKTNFGWDINFNAFGNNIIGLTDGYLRENFDKRSFNEMNPLYKNASSIRNYKYVNKIYLGADQPSIEYNTITQRFQISQLHTAERVQNNYNADEALKPVGSVAESVPEFETQGDIVYKINKRLMNTNFTPAMRPYNSNQYNVGIGTPSIDFEVFALNPNMKPWTIFDQLSGIIIKDFGVSEENWENSIWGILGFTYEQFNTTESSTNDLTSRVGNLNKNTLPYAFTNSNVNSKQTLDFTTNAFGAGIYTQQIPITQSFNGVYPQNASYWTGFQAQTYPSISETAESVVLSAPNLPRRIRSGFYCIRSDIISNSNYIGGPDSGWLYPILQVVDKVNDTDDYWVGGPSSLTYTFTENKMLTEIRTSITNPDQSLATIDSGTAVMYKLIKFVPNSFDIVGQIMSEENNKKKK